MLTLLLVAAVLADEAPPIEPCPEKPHAGFQIAQAQADGPQARALEEAREKARQKLYEQVCPPATEAAEPLWCESVRVHIVPFGEGRWTETQPLLMRGTACAVATVEQRYLQHGASDAALALGKDLDLLAGEIRRILGPAPEPTGGRAQGPTLAMEARWASGCLSAEVGEALIAHLRNRLPGYRVAQGAGPEDTLVSLSLTPGPREVVVSVVAGSGGDPRPTALGGFRFPADLFNVKDSETGDCVPDATLGITQTSRLGAGGLRVKVEVPTRDGQLCAGQRSSLTVVTNQPAEVRLFSVTPRDGVVLLWPPPGGSSVVAGGLPLGTLDAAPPPSGGQERLVAVAWRSGARAPAWADWRANCRLDSAADLAIPSNVAVGVTDFLVQEAGRKNCPSAGAYDPAQLLEAIRKLPVCGG